jgi:general secretion pathway protein D
MAYLCVLTALGLLFLLPLRAQTIAEKRASMGTSEGAPEDGIKKVNHSLTSLRTQLDSCYAKVSTLHEINAPDEEFQSLLREVNRLKKLINSTELEWRTSSVNEAKKDEEGYSLWDQEETTLAQLVMEYGATDYLYIVPPEMGGIKLNMHSGIPIPRESWSEVLEIILNHNGVGVKKLNPYTRQLFVFKQDPSAVHQIAARPSDLRLIPNHSRLFYLFSPPAEQVRSTFQFFERFSDPKQTFLYQVANKIAIVSSKEEIEKLINLYSTVWKDHKGKVSRVISVGKMSAKEMEKILTSFFGEAMDKGKAPFPKVDQEGLIVQTLGHGNALILIGSQELVDRAEKIVKETEEQLQEPSEMTIFLYTCRHSDPTDLANVLSKVYSSLLISNPEPGKEFDLSYIGQGIGARGPDGYPPSSPLVVAPPPLKPATTQIEFQEQATDNFIPDPKTGSLLMVVRRDALSKIKDLLSKLDIPKKMVQIEVLLFEKVTETETAYGLNFLKLGDHIGIDFFSGMWPAHKAGVLEFFAKNRCSNPKYNLAYNFLMTQDNVQLNAAPSIITVNQTPATINIVDEISINNGAAPVDTNKGTSFERSFSRQQYGITIVLTPTVHLPEDGNMTEAGTGFVTLETNITFDTPHADPKKEEDDRPRINRRHIENEVRVVDGQTVIIGGLRKKLSRDSEEKIPFIGDIPGIGKLFGANKWSDRSTEMFFFITPTIIKDPKEQMDYFRKEELKKRPGDLPEFLQTLVEARDKENRKAFGNSFKAIFGSKHSGY